MLPLNQTYNFDVFDGLSQLDDQSLNLVFADPPFNLGRSYGVDSDHREDYLAWCRQWIDMSIMKLKPGGVFVLHHIPKQIIPLGFYITQKLEFQNLVAWRTANMPISSRLLPEHFSFLIASKGPLQTFNRFGDTVEHKKCRHCKGMLADWGGKKKFMKPHKRVSDVWLDIERLRHRKNKHRNHNELPVKIMERLVKLYTNEGDLVLDLFMGAGTTAEACQKTKRLFIGFDNNPDYCQIANQRVIKS